MIVDDRSRPPPKPHDDPKGCLKVDSQSAPLSTTSIWSITGTDIYQVEGDGNHLVIKTPEYLGLWDMAKEKKGKRGKLRWE